jgi:probable HAF family extracellular repeat protein
MLHARYESSGSNDVVGVLLSAASFANAATTYTFDQFDVPGSTQTTPFGINDTGRIVGFFNDSMGTHGFLFAPRRDDGEHDRHGGDGSFTTIDVPGAFTTEARGINTAGQIVGFFLEGLFGPEHGFLFISRRDDGEHDKHASDGSFTQIDVPGVPGNTAALDINNVAKIVGGFGDSSGNSGIPHFQEAAGNHGSGANNQHEQTILATQCRFRLGALRSRLQVQLDLERRDVAV